MKQPRPILISRFEMAKAYKVFAETEAGYVAFWDYEIGEAPKGSALEENALDFNAMLNGTHPMFSREYIVAKIEQIKKECAEHGIEVENRPMHEVLIELNAKRKTRVLQG